MGNDNTAARQTSDRTFALSLRPLLSWQDRHVTCGTSWLRFGSGDHSLCLRGTRELQLFCLGLESHCTGKQSVSHTTTRFGQKSVTMRQTAGRWVTCEVEEQGDRWGLSFAIQTCYDLFAWFGLVGSVQAGPPPEDDYRPGIIRPGTLVLDGWQLPLGTADARGLQRLLLDSLTVKALRSNDLTCNYAHFCITGTAAHDYSNLTATFFTTISVTLRLSRTSMVRLAAGLGPFLEAQ